MCRSSVLYGVLVLLLLVSCSLWLLDPPKVWYQYRSEGRGILHLGYLGERLGRGVFVGMQKL